MKKLISTFALLIAGCSHASNPSANNSVLGNPAAVKWDSVSLFRSNSSGDCSEVDFQVTTDKNWNLEKCGQSVGAGNILDNEKSDLDQLVAQAVAGSQDRICPEVLKLDADYVSVISNNNSVSRSFDPGGKCYSGGESAVAQLRNYLLQLRSRYTGM